MNLSKPREALKNSLDEPRLCSILFDGRSGSLFLQTMLDGHPEVITMPGTLLLGPGTQKHINAYLTNPDNPTWNDVAEQFPQDFPTGFDATEDLTFCRLNELGPGRDQVLRVDVERFRAVLLGITRGIPCVPRAIFLAIHVAWEFARRGEVPRHPLIVHAMHTPGEEMRPVCMNFPDSKAIVMVREARASYASHFKAHINLAHGRKPGTSYWKDGAEAHYPRFILGMAMYGYSHIGQNLQAANVRAVKLEDLHLHPEAVMRAVADWLGIGYHPSLLSATICGLLHWGDSTIDYKNGPSYGELTHDWRKDYHWSDAMMIELMFLHRYRNYGYRTEFDKPYPSQPVIDYAILQPMRWELAALAGWLEVTEDEARASLATFLERPPEARVPTTDMEYSTKALAVSYAQMCARAEAVRQYMFDGVAASEPVFPVLR